MNFLRFGGILCGAGLSGEPKCDSNGVFDYPCTMVQEDWIFLLLPFIFK